MSMTKPPTPRVLARLTAGDVAAIATEVADLLELPDEQIIAMDRGAILASKVRNLEQLLVDNARSHGATWAEVGESFGITRSAAHARFSEST